MTTRGQSRQKQWQQNWMICTTSFLMEQTSAQLSQSRNSTWLQVDEVCENHWEQKDFHKNYASIYLHCGFCLFLVTQQSPLTLWAKGFVRSRQRWRFIKALLCVININHWVLIWITPVVRGFESTALSSTTFEFHYGFCYDQRLYKIKPVTCSEWQPD